MSIYCKICGKKYLINSEIEVQQFCDHVSKCPIRSDDLLWRYSCSICGNGVQLKKSFRSHILVNHVKKSLTQEKASSSPPNKKRKIEVVSRDIETMVIEEENLQPQHRYRQEDPIGDRPIIENESRKAHLEFEEELLLIVSKLMGKMSLPFAVCETIIEDFRNLIQSATSFLKKSVTQKCQSLEPEIQQLIEKCLVSTTNQINNGFNKIDSEHKLKNVLLKKNVLLQPKKKTFAEIDIQKGDDIVTKKCDVTILPIKGQIEQFLGRPGILEAVLANQQLIESDTSGSITHFLTAERWKKVRELFPDKTVIPISLFNDDYGPDDGLGPHGPANKISGYYYSFPTLPPAIASRLDSIFVAMLVKTEFIKIAGPNELLRILVEELKPLEEHGVHIGNQHIFIAPVLLLGDNLGLNYNLGVHGHRGFFFCRTCYMHRNVTQTSCYENPELLRTKEHYDMCINALASRNGNNFGILFETNLNKLKSFSFPEILIADIMHDLLSGVFIYAIVELLKKAIALNKFSLREFNFKKNRFDYGTKEKFYLIGDITTDHLNGNKIRGHSREILTFVKYLPAILSELLPANCPLRKFSGIMNDLLQVCLKNSFNEEGLTRLENVTTKFNQEFLRLFNSTADRPLPPKAHHLLHYARIVRNSGPLKHLWSMRFESKHQESKAYAKVCHSRVNLCLSLGRKFCYNNAYNYLKNDELLKNVTEIKVNGKRLIFSQENLNMQHFESCDRAKFKGTSYLVNDFILSNCLQFAYKILEIGVDFLADNLLLIVGTYNIGYNQSLRMYYLQENTHSTSSKKVEELLYPPISSHKFAGRFYLHFEEF